MSRTSGSSKTLMGVVVLVFLVIALMLSSLIDYVADSSITGFATLNTTNAAKIIDLADAAPPSLDKAPRLIEPAANTAEKHTASAPTSATLLLPLAASRTVFF